MSLEFAAPCGKLAIVLPGRIDYVYHRDFFLARRRRVLRIKPFGVLGLGGLSTMFPTCTSILSSWLFYGENSIR